MPSTTRRRGPAARLGLALLALGVALGVVACGDSGGSAGGDGAVTITHNYGETVVEGTPERIVTLGNQWLDATQAFGITPVGYADNISIGAKTKVPWEPDSLSQATVLNAGGDIAEQIAGLEPDLILVPSYLVDQAMYDKLGKLAPTIGAVTPNAQVDNWVDQVTALGRILGREDDAEGIVDGVDAKVDEFAAKYPGLRGKTFLTCMLTGPAQLMVLADPKDGSAALFERLGMSIPQQIAAEAPAGGRLALSPERLGDLTSDMLVCGAMPAFEEKFKQLPGYAELPAVKSGGIAFIDVMTISALNTPTPLNTRYVLDKLAPTFEALNK
ncbi:ABC transporter substrate-binding protein [Nocardia harenae]|uniref:ABC transporter substrate-binding protein n=1 Tax=Nocardia harenae TaxID=358707 RepID=UPI0008368FE3|nr:ABC transporter substrate-binding protein [Nocardia harenae]